MSTPPDTGLSPFRISIYWT